MHVPLIWHRMWTIDERTHITFMPQFYDGMGSFVLTFAVALLATIFCERTLLFLKEIVMGETGGETRRDSKMQKHSEAPAKDSNNMDSKLKNNLHFDDVENRRGAVVELKTTRRINHELAASNTPCNLNISNSDRVGETRKDTFHGSNNVAIHL
ncbi:nose resistant to fluoxetine protein 6-like [Tropilaelaps mercedesae]|uniref:Nose resistant to fluoxetine protein 6-like n=1 Tax=Tropilaelaps mercedesae TaxID=418985 RepID=A0A1V9XVR5_9ACAR|nr:nose resistant to fluoxetine protein 6-like [Tropilaelaps mercedesae]